MNVMNATPLKITRSGQSSQVQNADGSTEANPQADLISELKVFVAVFLIIVVFVDSRCWIQQKGRPQLRRTAAQRPSKKDILTRNANARMQEERRPDPSVVKV